MELANGIRGKLFVISGPSGAGKTTLCEALLKNLKLSHIRLERLVTSTTRPPRPGEENNKDYHFISKEEFLEKQKKSFFFESVTYHGHFYGSPRSLFSILETGKSLVLITDRKGMKMYKSHIPAAVTLWITPSDYHVLEKRIIKRDQGNSSRAQKRFERATEEFKAEQSNPCADRVIINDDFDEALKSLTLFICKELSS